ncbi:MAG: ABC transporter permease [Chloroflexi bacterium]|nr:ABC transporter permease [Chloroflexota bacterium]
MTELSGAAPVAPSQADSTTPRAGRRSWPHQVIGFLSRSGLLLSLILLIVVLTIFAPNFLTSRNLLNVIRQVSFVGIIACGMTMAMIAADVDLSVGSMVAFASALLGVSHVNLALPLWLAVLVTLAVGTTLGLAAGWLRVRWNIPALIVTLAFLISFRGLAFILTNAFPIMIADDAFEFWGKGEVLGVPVPAIIFVVVVISFMFISTRTVYGRSVYAVGGNAEAARLSGIPVDRIRIMILVTTFFLSALTGVLLSSRLSSANASIAVGMEFDVIAAVLIGGTSLFGGKGSILGTVLGVLFIGLLGNGMVLLDVNTYLQDVARGGIILLAVLLGALQEQRKQATTS